MSAPGRILSTVIERAAGDGLIESLVLEDGTAVRELTPFMFATKFAAYARLATELARDGETVPNEVTGIER